jgi:hypothetical protein
VRDVELLHLPHPSQLRRQRSGELVEAGVEHRDLAEPADLRREAGLEAVVDEQDLVERARHVGDARREAAAEAVVSEDDDGRRRAAEVVGELEAEAVMVEEDGVEREVEERGGHGALEVVEAEVEEAERREGEHRVGERAHEAVVAEVELVEADEAAERGGRDAAEAVGVEVQQREVGEEAQLRREEPRDVAVVEVHAGDGDGVGIRRQRRAEYARVVADLRARPVGGEVVGVGEDGLLLPRLQRDVRIPQPPAREPPRRAHFHLSRPRLAAG